MLGAILVLVAAGAGGVFLRPAGGTDHVLEARMGDVVWNHEFHARMRDIANCTVCHHKEHKGVTNPRPCTDCHKLIENQYAIINGPLFGITPPPPDVDIEGVSEPAYAMQAFHGKCVGCHKAMKQGPVLCFDCHSQSFAGKYGRVDWDHRLHSRIMTEMDCDYCHHKDKEAQTPEDFRPCSECHQPVETMPVSMSTGTENHETLEHGECHTCHTTDDPEKGVRHCTLCHQDMEPWPEKGGEESPPSIDQAIHTRCLECHNTKYAGLTTRMPVICDDCHQPDPSFMHGGTAGPVMWSHERHADFAGLECSRCHHMDQADEPQLACYRCHGAGDYGFAPSLREATHVRCTQCHTESSGFHGPRDQEECATCHARGAAGPELFRGASQGETCFFDHREHATSYGLSCRECHHNTLRKDGFPFTVCKSSLACPEEADQFQSCINCHGRRGPGPLARKLRQEPPVFSEALQKACNNCHDELEIGPPECVDLTIEKAKDKAVIKQEEG